MALSFGLSYCYIQYYSKLMPDHRPDSTRRSVLASMALGGYAIRITPPARSPVVSIPPAEQQLDVVRARMHIKPYGRESADHLVLCDDEQYYVVKLPSRTHGPRTLVNELISSLLLGYLKLPTPDWALVDVPDYLLASTPEMVATTGGQMERYLPGLCFAYRYPVDLCRQSLFSYVPENILRASSNLPAFAGTLAYDKWVSKADARHAVFFKNRRGFSMDQDLTLSKRREVGVAPSYCASMVNHRHAFGGTQWSLLDSPPEQGLYRRHLVYEHVTGFKDFEPWMDKILEIPANLFDHIRRHIPPEWYDRRPADLDSMLEELFQRRRATPDLVRRSKRSRRDPFRTGGSDPCRRSHGRLLDAADGTGAGDRGFAGREQRICSDPSSNIRLLGDTHRR